MRLWRERLCQGRVKESCGYHSAWGMYGTAASPVLQEPSTSRSRPIPSGRETSPEDQGGFGQVGMKHTETSTGTQGKLCMHGLPVFLLYGEPEGLLV